ncbi:HAD family hydrolase [Oxalobacteraceae bacterium A2-2]
MHADSRPAGRTVIFDLDGTLIDSAPSILAGFEQALRREGIAPAQPLSPALIGPPLAATLALLSGSSDPALLAALAGHFKQYYDSEGYRLSTVYPGVPEMLARLHGDGVALHLATNKRHLAARQILDYLGWLPLFRSVYALDMVQPAHAGKDAMLAAQLAAEGIAGAVTAYVGDRDEDRVAAEANGLEFIGVRWGYGQFGADAGHAVLDQAAQLPALLAAR